jgi:subtilisin-like proprotein convertase family protein
LPLVFADHPGEGNQPEAYTAIVVWNDDAYQSIVGRAFLPPSSIALPQFVGLIGLVRTYQNTTVTPIPDNNPTGATVRIDVAELLTFHHVDVTVDIEHTYQPDLTVEIFKNGVEHVNLLQHEAIHSGPTQNISETYRLYAGTYYSLIGPPLELSQAQGSWTLKVVDTAAQDAGRIKLFRLRFYR